MLNFYWCKFCIINSRKFGGKSFLNLDYYFPLLIIILCCIHFLRYMSLYISPENTGASFGENILNNGMVIQI